MAREAVVAESDRMCKPAVLPRRVVVYGPSGSGKSTLARRLGEILGLPSCELDALFHNKPGWQDASDEEFRASVEAFLAANPDGWVIDGNYSRVRDSVLPRADTVVWLRLPFRVVYPRLVRRTLRRMMTRELLWGTNRESFRDVFLSRESMLIWGARHFRSNRRKIRASLRAVEPRPHVIVLKSPREVREFEQHVRRVARTATASRILMP